MGDIRGLIRNLVIDNFIVDPETFTDETDLKETGMLDSWQLIRLVTFIEQQFAVEMRAEDLKQLDVLFSIANIDKFVRARKS